MKIENYQPPMDDMKINFLGHDNDPSRRKFFFFLKLFSALVISIGLLATLIVSNRSEDGLLASINEIPIFKRVSQLIRSADRSLDGQKDDRINILLLGMGGVGHDGPFLTDTVILASIKPSTKQIALTSIPRDLAVPIPDYGWYKLNHANAFGETQDPGEGGALTKKVLEDVFDIPIHYYVRVDFDGFTKLIDDLGGIDTYVERSFTDEQYPTDHEGNVMTVSFENGWQHMNGETALMFARSRHGSNNEAGDFARARRQQKILFAVKSKVFSLGTLRSPSKISAVNEALHDHVKTNFSAWELLAFSRLGGTLDTENMITEVLDDGPNGFLSPTIGVDGAYLLMPRGNSWSAVRTFLNDIFGNTAIATDPEKIPKPVRVEIQNGTYVTGLAGQTANRLREAGFVVTNIGNATTKNSNTTIIYDLSDGNNPEAANKLAELLNATVTKAIPDWIFTPDVDPQTPAVRTPDANAANRPDVDFLIILGTDQ